MAIDQGEYKILDNCKDVSLLASAFKLFLRELPEPLIKREMKKALFKSEVDFERKNADVNKLAQTVQEALQYLDPLAARVLKYVLQHMKRMSDLQGIIFNLMCHLF